jgi:hypothetical protein
LYFSEGYYEGEEGVEELTEQGQATLQRLENMLRGGQGDGPPAEHTNGHQDEEGNSVLVNVFIHILLVKGSLLLNG